MNNNSFTYNAEEDPLSIYLQPFYSKTSFEPNHHQSSQPQPHLQQPNSQLIILPINELMIKEKLQKINTSLYSIFLTDKAKESFQSITTSIVETLSVSSSAPASLCPNQTNLLFIDHFLTLIIELICQMKEEINAKEAIIDKFNLMTKAKEDSDRKCTEMQKDLKSKQRELDLQFNKSQLEKEKNSNNRKLINNELNDLKVENKKLLSQIGLYKNELRKKDMHYSKIQEKLKAVLTKGYASQCKNNPDIISSLYMKPSNDFYHEGNELLSNTIERSNMKKIKEITDLNSELMSLLQIIHSYLIRISTTANDKRIHLKGEKKIVMIKDDMFTIHLIHPHVMSEFSISFLNNISYVDEMINWLIEMVIEFKRQRLAIKNKEKNEEVQKRNIKINDKEKEKEKKDAIKNENALIIEDDKKNKINDDELENKNKKKWFENIVNKKVSYAFNEEDVLKCENDSDDNNNENDNIDIENNIN